ncbi:MAG TPA: cupredoxin domain-containing protein [Candidatus Dormibacteraeota bacterium]|nr:cupredoxin domain-containing protein [Candidatus Dormibacteraeota bacterium]
MPRNRARLVGAGLVALAVIFTATTVVLAATRPHPSTSIDIVIHYSHFEPSSVLVPVGVPVTFTIRNDDPIDHEWIVGDAAVQEQHRVGTDVVHNTLPTEQMIPAGETRVTTVTFSKAGTLQYICHLPGHEAYGMVGLVTIR